MTLRRYERYKYSGVEWLGAVPAHWGVTRLKFIAHVQTGVAKGKDNAGKQTMAVPYLRVANVQDGYLDLDEVATIELPADDLPRYRLRAGDVLMNEGGDYDKLGRGHVWDGSIDPCIHQNHVFAVRPFGVSPQWLNLVTGSAYAQFYFMSRSKQSTNLASISSTNVMELPVVLPPAPEQSAIAAFLEREVTKIDTLIAEQQRLIELLIEKRHAVIAQAVAKGLDPNVPMKDSGVMWLGPVPAHWGVGHSRRMFAVRSEPAMAGDRMLTASQKYGVLYQADFVELECRRVVEVIMGLESLKHVEPDDFIISMRSFQGGIEWCKLRGSTSFHYVMLRPVKQVHPPFFAHLFKSITYIQALRATTDLIRDGQELRYSNFVQVDLPVVPIDEQKRIAEYLDRQTAKLDELAEVAADAIDILRERRTALISAAVTGQIDVRQPSPTQSTPAAHLQPHDEPHGL